MTYTWNFYTGGRAVEPIPDVCHRGPMVPIEEVIATPFTMMDDFEIFRAAILNKLVEVDFPAVQTRELLLRVIETPLVALFPELDTQRESLQANICSRRRSVDIEADLQEITPFINNTVRMMGRTNAQMYSLDRIQEYLESNTPVARVAGKCAIILYAAYRESGVVDVFG
jgi:hypothetical protein